MKICFLANADHANTLNWARYFSREYDHDVHIISFNSTALNADGVTVHTLKGFFTKTKLKYLLCANQVRKIISKISPDIIIGYRINSYGILGSQLGFHPFVLAAQGQNIVYPPNSIIKKFFVKRAIKESDFINSWADHMSQKLVDLGAKNSKIMTLPRGVDTELFKPGIKSDLTKRAITNRGLNPRYNQGLIIKSIPKISENVKNFEYLVVGDGPEKSKLMNIINELNLNKAVKLLGRVEHEEVASLLRKCDLYISLVRTDGVSSSLLEAMACGLFPIVPKNPSNNEWVLDKKNGILLSDISSESVSKAVVFAFNNKELIEKSKKYNRALINKRASWRNNLGTINRAYELLVSRTNKI